MVSCDPSVAGDRPQLCLPRCPPWHGASALGGHGVPLPLIFIPPVQHVSCLKVCHPRDEKPSLQMPPEQGSGSTRHPPCRPEACRQFQGLDCGNSDRKSKAGPYKHIYHHMQNQIASRKSLCDAGSSNLALCDDRLEGRMGWEEAQEEGTDVYLWLIRADVWEKSIQRCKGITLQLTIN